MNVRPETTDLPVHLLTAYQTAVDDQPEWVVQAPGREMWLAATVIERDTYTLHAPELESRTTFTRRSAAHKQTHTRRPLPKWARYPAGVTCALHEQGVELPGVVAVVYSIEPPGIRFEYSLGIALAAFWHELNDLPYTQQTILDLVENVRRDYIGG